ncbi:hypothetical protein NDU88_006624 [Pleurodeles waltl]|uniref:Uncharacterized protein n=1 Tax=Pleurodeles waltl TaxID=8319 RepID=A0AAV7LSG7_PLEWA|nr:hypothetical protein NDU88_006624 [Pleurodeles waltl]
MEQQPKSAGYGITSLRCGTTAQRQSPPSLALAGPSEGEYLTPGLGSNCSKMVRPNMCRRCVAPSSWHSRAATHGATQPNLSRGAECSPLQCHGAPRVSWTPLAPLQRCRVLLLVAVHYCAVGPAAVACEPTSAHRRPIFWYCSCPMGARAPQGDPGQRGSW